MLGHAAAHVLAEDFEVHATVRDPAAALRFGIPAQLHAFDAYAPEALPAILTTSGADAVLNCIGVVKQLDDASRPVPSITLNSLFPHQAAEASAAAGARFVHVSTDCVFSGELAPPARYTEDDLPDARDLYGRSKLLGEVGSGGLTLRTSIIGWELDRASGLLQWFASQKGGSARGFANAWFSGLTTRALARVVGRILREAPDLEGLYQVSSEPISKYDLLVALNDALELDCAIERVEEPRINRSLDSSRFQDETGIGVPSWEEMIREYATGGSK
jgi:dTDP-4-dehydrorhamnose reductase